jgi:hypothetical protein
MHEELEEIGKEVNELNKAEGKDKAKEEVQMGNEKSNEEVSVEGKKEVILKRKSFLREVGLRKTIISTDAHETILREGEEVKREEGIRAPKQCHWYLSGQI